MVVYVCCFFFFIAIVYIFWLKIFIGTIMQSTCFTWRCKESRFTTRTAQTAPDQNSYSHVIARTFHITYKMNRRLASPCCNTAWLFFFHPNLLSPLLLWTFLNLLSLPLTSNQRLGDFLQQHDPDVQPRMMWACCQRFLRLCVPASGLPESDRVTTIPIFQSHERLKVIQTDSAGFGSITSIHDDFDLWLRSWSRSTERHP